MKRKIVCFIAHSARGFMKKKLKSAISALKKNLNLTNIELKALESIEQKIALIEDVANVGQELKKHKKLLEGDYDLVIYSDGACRGNPGPGSYGLYVEGSTGEVFKDSEAYNLTTNNKMELLGIIKGLEFAKSKQVKNVLVVTDSKYAINGMESWVAGWKSRGWKKADKKTPENVDMWQILDSFKTDFDNLKFEWVKGHSGHPQNEFCDQLANMALDEAGY